MISLISIYLSKRNKSIRISVYTLRYIFYTTYNIIIYKNSTNNNNKNTMNIA